MYSYFPWSDHKCITPMPVFQILTGQSSETVQLLLIKGNQETLK